MTLRAEALTHHYRTRQRSVAALRDADLEVGPGAGIAVVGESGSGKSTLLHALLHLLQPTAGRVTLDGAPVRTRRDLRHFRRAVQFVPQDAAASLDPRRRVGVQVREPLLRLRVTGDADAAVADALAQVALPSNLATTTPGVDPVTRTPSWRVPLSGPAGEDVLDGIDEEEKDVHAGVSA